MHELRRVTTAISLLPAFVLGTLIRTINMCALAMTAKYPVIIIPGAEQPKFGPTDAQTLRFDTCVRMRVLTARGPSDGPARN